MWACQPFLFFYLNCVYTLKPAVPSSAMLDCGQRRQHTSTEVVDASACLEHMGVMDLVTVEVGMPALKPAALSSTMPD